MTNKKTDPSALFSDSLSTFNQSATKAFNDWQAQIRVEVTRAEVETRQVRNERDQALKALQDSRKELQKYKEETLECRASLKEAELTIKHHVENYALLQREMNQWKGQAKNWQEHFLRVEHERCSLSSRMNELVTERLILPPTPSYPSKLTPSTSSVPRLPTYQSAVPPSSENFRGQQQSRSTTKATKRKVPSQSELPPYSETVQTPQTAKASTSNSAPRSNRKEPAPSVSRTKKTPPSVSKEQQEPKQILIRRVHAVVEVKREEVSDEDLSSDPSSPESPEEPALTPRRSYNARRARQIIDDEDEYVPDGVSPEIGSNEAEVEYEDDELMIGAGDDLSFDISSPSVARRTSVTKTVPNKKRKLNASANSKPKARRKT